MTIRIGRPGHGYPITAGDQSAETVRDVLDSAAKHEPGARFFAVRAVSREWERTISGWEPITVFRVTYNDD